MLENIGKTAKEAYYRLAVCSSIQKNTALDYLAQKLIDNIDPIIAANRIDMEKAAQENKTAAFCDRLLLTAARIKDLAAAVTKIRALSDPIGEIIEQREGAQGIKLQCHRIPLGVVAAIYESRPNVTIDIASLCLKTGNAAILRGGSETLHTNRVLITFIQEALVAADLPSNTIQYICNPDRKYVLELLKLDKYVDMLIPRGGTKLHNLCRHEATMPVMSGGIGVCHIFMDASADIDNALPILVNAKTQRPGTCNSTETLLVHRDIALQLWLKLSTVMAQNGVTLHADIHAYPYLQQGPASVVPLQPQQLALEWLSLDLNVVVVADVNAAIRHIRQYGSGHSEAILTRTEANANTFIRQLDSAAIYVNASTRFTDGEQFGLGAEVAVSTQKLHARGPMGLKALTTYKWVGVGDNLCRL